MIAEPAPIWKKKPIETGISIKKITIVSFGFEKLYRLQQNCVYYSYHS